MKKYTYEELNQMRLRNREFMKATDRAWNTSLCSSSSVVGPLMDILYKNECDTFEKWMVVFNENVTPTQMNNCYFKFVNKLQENSISFTKEQVLETILVHTILQTYDGAAREIEVKKWLKEQPYIKEVSHTNAKIDEDSRIDFICTLENGARVNVQVKPESFIYQVVANKDYTFNFIHLLQTMNNYCRKNNLVNTYNVVIVSDDNNHIHETNKKYFNSLVSKLMGV